MNGARILVVEDERIMATDIADTLVELGYEVVGIEGRGQSAIDTALRTKPDLIMMDIMLQGNIDGIEAATTIRRSIDIPVVYLTAYADDRIVERAKLSGPFGYLIKPFENASLHVTIEMALYKHEIDGQLRAVLETAGAVPWELDVRTLKFTYVGPQVERITGYPVTRWTDVDFWKSIVSPDELPAVADAMREVVASGVDRELEYRLLTGDGGVKWVRHIVNCVVKDDRILLRGFMFDIDERKKTELERERLIAELNGALGKIKTLRGLLPICAWCKKIRDDRGYWSQVEEYIQGHSDAEFTHGMCPDCQGRMEKELKDFEK